MRNALRILLTGAFLLSVPAVAGAADVRLASLPVAGGAPLRAPFAFDLVGARWRGGGHVELRSRTLAGPWSSWTALAPGEDVQPQAGVTVAEPIWTGSGRIVQLRASPAVRALRAIVVNGSHGPSARVSRSPSSLTAAPTIHTRAEWGADESMRRAMPLYAPSVQMAFVHHTATSNDYTESQVPSILRSIYTYHVRANGWNDIGYNYLVDRFGQIWEGRYGGITQNVVGAQTLGFNTGSVGIAYIGDGQSTPLTDAGRAALVALLSWRLDLAHVDPRSTTTMTSGGNPKYASGKTVSLRAVSGHRDGTLTDCPGDTIYAQLPSIADDAYASGLPKIFAPEAGSLTSYPVRFAATLSGPLSWTVRVLDASGTTIASKAGTGTSVAWTWDGRSAAGAPVASGVAASWSIEAQDAAGNRALPATGGLLGTTAPVVQGAMSGVTVAPTSISPDGDGQADAATVTFSLATATTAAVTVQNSLGTTLSTVLPPTAMPPGPVTLNWNGAAVDPGTTVADGAYRVVVTTTDAAGVPSSASAPISVVRAATGLTGPRLAVSPNRDGRGDRVTFHWAQQQPAHAQLRLVSASAQIATVLDADLPAGPAHATWDGKTVTKLMTGELGAVLTLTTEAGQQLLQTTFMVDLTPPRVGGLQARTRAGGGFVRYRLSEAAYVQLRVQGHLIGRYVLHKAGVGGIRYRLAGKRARTVELRLLDLAGNGGRGRIVLRR